MEGPSNRTLRMMKACIPNSSGSCENNTQSSNTFVEENLTSISENNYSLDLAQESSASNLLKKSVDDARVDSVQKRGDTITPDQQTEMEEINDNSTIFQANQEYSNLNSKTAEKNSVACGGSLSIQSNPEQVTPDGTSSHHEQDSSATEFHEDSDDSIADPDYRKTSEQSSVSEDNIRNSSSEEGTDPTKSVENRLSKGKKKRARPETWQRNIRKKSILGGKEHNYKTKVIRAKAVGTPCKDTCSFKCKERFSEDVRNSIHAKFWNPNQSVDLKRQYVSAMVQLLVPVSRNREKTGSRSGKRQFTRQYGFELNGVKIKVCQKFFTSTLNISQTFITTALRKKNDGGVVGEDLRGKHQAVNKIPEDVRQGVRNHIQRLPIIETHNSRERSKKKYLGNDLNLSRMYELYKAECHEKNTPENLIAKQWLYSEIFQTEFNLSFKLPYNDTCDECDKFLLKKNQATDFTEKESLQQEYIDHLDEASNRYALKRQDKELAKNSEGRIKMITVDLQKCLPTPVLTNAQSFYTLKLWTYNYTINEANENITTCVMWDESKSGRGGNEMASGMLKWATGIDNKVTEITIWSDNCSSQNRNVIMVMVYFWIINQNPNLKTINHKFLLRGHTHLEVDGDHSLIEREKKKTPFLQIMTPWDWQQIARLCNRTKPFKVVNMEVLDFKDFKTLYSCNPSPFIHRKKATGGNDFYISKVVHLQVRADQMGKLFYKTSFDSDHFECVDLNRTGRRVTFPASLASVRQEANCISTKKYKHLQSLLPWVPSQFHQFYEELSHSDKVTDDM